MSLLMNWWICFYRKQANVEAQTSIKSRAIKLGSGPNFKEMLEMLKAQKVAKYNKLSLQEQGYQPNYHATCSNCDWYPTHFCFAETCFSNISAFEHLSENGPSGSNGWWTKSWQVVCLKAAQKLKISNHKQTILSLGSELNLRLQNVENKLQQWFRKDFTAIYHVNTYTIILCSIQQHRPAYSWRRSEHTDQNVLSC